MATDEMGEKERVSLALFLDTLRSHAQTMSAIIVSYGTPAELIADAKKLGPGSQDNNHATILAAAGPFFETEVDLMVDVDRESVGVMRRKIDEGVRRGETMEQRRITRIATFAGEVATWQAEQDMYEHTEEAYPGAIPRQLMSPPVVFMEPGAAEAV
jgi:hypothetical protein